MFSFKLFNYPVCCLPYLLFSSVGAIQIYTGLEACSFGALEIAGESLVDVYIPVTGIPDPYDGKFTAGFFYCLEIDLILPRRYP